MKKCLRDMVLLMIFSCGNDILVIPKNGNNAFYNFLARISCSQCFPYIFEYIYMYLFFNGVLARISYKSVR